MTFICYPKCTTCQKARKWLDENHIAYDIRDIKTDNPTYGRACRVACAQRPAVKEVFQHQRPAL